MRSSIGIGDAGISHRRLRIDARLAFGLIVVAVLLVCAIFAPLIAPYDPNTGDFSAVLAEPSLSHPLGTDFAGRDILSRLIYGARITAQVSVASVALAVVLGGLLGLAAGYFGGLFDQIIARFFDALLAFPALVLMMAIAGAIGPGVTNILIALTVVFAPAVGRVVRAEAIRLRHADYVDAATVLGATDSRIIFRHVTPNLLTSVIVLGSYQLAQAVLAEASISFLGFGVRPPTSSWGLMVVDGQQYLATEPWVLAAPGVVISIAIFGLNMLGDGLTNVMRK